jgi:hypothetical protein
MMTTLSNIISFIISQKGWISRRIQKRNDRCLDPYFTVTVHTDLDDIILNITDDHCHPSEPEEIQIWTFKQAVKTRAINESTPIPQLYDEEAARINLSTLSIAALSSQREIS